MKKTPKERTAYDTYSPLRPNQLPSLIFDYQPTFKVENEQEKEDESMFIVKINSRRHSIKVNGRCAARSATAQPVNGRAYRQTSTEFQNRTH
jgi:hypothetical protein